MLKPGLGSISGRGALDNYLRSPFARPNDLGHKTITVGGAAIDCTGIEVSETNHKIGAARTSISTTAYRQWANDEPLFGVVQYHFEQVRMDGTSFNQRLTLTKSGESAVTALPDSK